MLPNGATGAAWRLAPGAWRLAPMTLSGAAALINIASSSGRRVRAVTALLSVVDTGVADFRQVSRGSTRRAISVPTFPNLLSLVPIQSKKTQYIRSGALAKCAELAKHNVRSALMCMCAEKSEVGAHRGIGEVP